MGFLDWFSRKSPAEKIASELEQHFQTKGTLEGLVREIDKELTRLIPRIMQAERNVSSYTKGNVTALKAERTTLEIKKMDLQRDIRKVDGQISGLLAEQRKLKAA